MRKQSIDVFSILFYLHVSVAAQSLFTRFAFFERRMVESVGKRTPRSTRFNPRLKTGILVVLVGLGVGAQYFARLGLPAPPPAHWPACSLEQLQAACRY